MTNNFSQNDPAQTNRVQAKTKATTTKRWLKLAVTAAALLLIPRRSSELSDKHSAHKSSDLSEN